MTELKVFSNTEFGQVRTVESNGNILFCGSDVARALGYAIPSKAVNTHCKGVSKMETPTAGGIQEMLFIPEPDYTALLFLANSNQQSDSSVGYLRKSFHPSARQDNISKRHFRLSKC